jgi:hypothetical protein
MERREKELQIKVVEWWERLEERDKNYWRKGLNQKTGIVDLYKDFILEGRDNL